MNESHEPGIDPRRADDFRGELVERARAWIGDWEIGEARGDFGLALMEVAARLSSQVAERLDRAGRKMSLGLLDWLAVRGEAAKAARMPVVFKRADTAREPVLATKPVRLQADVAGASVVFETESDVNLVAGRLDLVVGVDAGADKYFLPPPGLTSLDPLEPLPDQWTLKNFAQQDATLLQLDPALGLTPGTLVEMGGNQYRVTTAEGDLAGIEPGIQPAAGLPAGTQVTRVTVFDPLGTAAHNWQQHIIYLGDKDLFNLEAAATIEVVGAEQLAEATWEFFGKAAADAEPTWLALPVAPGAEQNPGALKLKKPAGAVELTQVGSAEPSRWIRARQTTVTDPNAMLNVESLTVIVNRGDDKVACPESGAIVDPGAEAEGFTNSTPLVVSSVFYPLGREPRQFDTFYLGCADAFSKQRAKVSICFELADLSAASFATVRQGAAANRVLASLGQDSALHLFAVDASGALSSFANRDPLQPPTPGANGVAVAGQPVPLIKKPSWRAPMWTQGGNDFYVGTSAGTAVWVWKEVADHPELSGWISFQALPAQAGGGGEIAGLVYLHGTAPLLYALLDGALYYHSADENQAATQWTRIDPLGGLLVQGGTYKLTSIVPVYSTQADGWQTSLTDGMAGIVEGPLDASVHTIDALGQCAEVEPGIGALPGTLPAAVRIGTSRHVFWHLSNDPVVLHAAEIDNAGNVAGVDSQPTADPPATILGGSLESLESGGSAMVVAAGGRDDDSWLINWTPFAAVAGTSYFEIKLPADSGPLGGAPTVLDQYVVVPGSRADAWVSAWDSALRVEHQAQINASIVTSESFPALAPNDSVIVDRGGQLIEQAQVFDFGTTSGGERLHALVLQAGAIDFGVGLANPALFVYRYSNSSAALSGPVNAADEMILDPSDNATVAGNWLLVASANGIGFCRVDAVTPGPHPRTATFLPLPNPALAGAFASYWRGEPLPGRIAPFMDLNPNTTGNWNAALLDRADLRFAGLDPERQRGKAFEVDSNNRPTLVALAANWNAHLPNGNPRTFLLDASLSGWSRQLGDSTSNPELIWEYWNGTNWWKLTLDLDETLHLKRTGKVKFPVPTSLMPTEVSGRSNHWIRARLIGGDYGREQVKVITTPIDPPGSTEQTIVRSAGDFRPPSVVKMRIRYSVEDAVYPAYLLTQDSGSLRNQSDANRTQGALIEAFVPLSVLMARLERGGAVEIAEPDCAPDCDCHGAGENAADSGNAQTSTAPVVATSTGQSLMLGFDAQLLGEPVNVLLLVEERAHDGFAPLTVEALVNDRFEQLTVRDTTRALGESGLLSLAFPVKPSPRELFGRSLTWLRLRPSRAPAAGEWRPVIRGAYLNAAWASATETLTREALGSSDGRPRLTLQVARPPLLHQTLELRVREPLDEEERNALLEADPARVKTDMVDLPGDWVLWQQVADPADQGPGDRVYALDEATGEIQFGDGIHGMIPPTGRDAVVAFSYQRTEPAANVGEDVPANRVTARTALNLVTPVETVEAAIAADRAAGGSPAESNERVLRFGTARLRHRGRAITLQDFEDLALQSSPDVVQARASKRAGGLKLVVVMRGQQPRPSAGQRRELRRLLQQAATPLLGTVGAIAIDGPRVRRLRVKLTLRVSSLDEAGRLSSAVKRSLAQFFDSAAGGLTGQGWSLGAAPADDDIAYALAAAPALEGIAGIEMLEVAADGTERPWRAEVRPDELVMLAADAVRIRFEAIEVDA